MKKIYMPILKGKSGEFTALKNLSSTVKKNIIPLIEVDPVDIDIDTGFAKKSYNNHLDGYFKKFTEIGEDVSHYLIDANLIDEEHISSEDIDPLENILSQLTENKIKAIPVINLYCQQWYRSSIKKNINHSLGLRVTPLDLLAPDDINNLLRELEVTKAETYLIIDFEYVDDESNHIKNIHKAIKAIQDLSEWKDVVLAAGSFPTDMSGIDRGISSVTRIEWRAWCNLIQQPNLGRNFIFADYAVQHPEFRRLEVDPRFISMTASIRYTGQEDFIIIKGKNVRQHGYEQFGDHSQVLVKHPAYSGKDFSDGDSQIHVYAEKRDLGESKGFGNATTWRWISTNHHITLVVNQLSS